MDSFLSALFVVYNYSHLSLPSLSSLINKFTNWNYNEDDYRKLITRVNMLPDAFGKSFFVNMNIKNEIDSILKQESSTNFETYALSCVFCSSSFIAGKKYQAECYFYNQQPTFAIISSKFCVNCKAEHFLCFGEKNLKRKLFNNILEFKFVSFTNETIFDVQILNSFTSDLIYKHSSYEAYSNSYNNLFKCKQDYCNGIQRACLNEKRLTESWLYYNYILIHYEFYGGFELFTVPYMMDLDQHLGNLKPHLLSNFVNKWSSI